jgi:hypothetical protein
MRIAGDYYTMQDVVQEVGRGIVFILAAAGWGYFMLLLMVD